MKHENLSKDQLIKELDDAHQQITKLKKSLSMLMQDKEMLVQSDKSVRMHFTSSNDAILSFDNQLTIQNISPNVERILGYRPEELVGKPFPSLNVLHPEDLEDAVDSALHVLSGGIVHSNILRFITKDGAEKYGEVSGVPITREGHVVAATSVIRDVTERIKNQEELQKYREHLEDMVKDRSAKLNKANKRLAHEIEEHKRT
jgi:PAS domain S-box-containing protein